MKKIESICNKILKDSKDKNINFIDWLHYVKNHEYLLKKYHEDQFKFLKIISNIFIYLLINLRNLFLNSSKFMISERNLDFVLISHKLNNNLNIKDNYFGDVRNFFKKKKINFEMLFFSHIKSQNEKNIINHASFIEKIEIFFYILSKFFKIIIFSKSFIGNYTFEIRLKVASEFLSPKTFENFIIHKNLKKINKSKKIKNLIIPFEGFSYERVIFFSFSNSKLKTNLLGYQHASIIKSQNGIFRKLNKEYNPEIILTSGLETKKILKKYYPSKKIFIFGSNKISHISIKKKNKTKSNILVLPEGIESECFYMMKFILNKNFYDKKINFIFRLHPSLSFDYLKKRYSIFKIRKKNVILSKKSLDEDIKNSEYCLYRGTTSVINCIVRNLYPIFLNKKNYNDIDTLFSQKKIPKINNSNDLIKIIKKNKKKSLSKKLKKFGKEYFTKINYEILTKFI